MITVKFQTKNDETLEVKVVKPEKLLVFQDEFKGDLPKLAVALIELQNYCKPKNVSVVYGKDTKYRTVKIEGARIEPSDKKDEYTVKEISDFLSEQRKIHFEEVKGKFNI